MDDDFRMKTEAHMIHRAGGAPGSVGDVFTLVALGELIAALRPGEYWEGHAGGVSANAGGGGPAALEWISPEARALDVLRGNAYLRMLGGGAAAGSLRTVPGSSAMALQQLGGQARRLLFCDVEAESLQQIRTLAGNNAAVECVQEDGVAVLRGAALMLPAQWSASTLAFLRPADAAAQTDAGITAVELWCELANRGIHVALAYDFSQAQERRAVQGHVNAALEKALLLRRGAVQMEGVMRGAEAGFGLLINVPATVADRVEKTLRGLERVCDRPGTVADGFEFFKKSV